MCISMIADAASRPRGVAKTLHLDRPTTTHAENVAELDVIKSEGSLEMDAENVVINWPGTESWGRAGWRSLQRDLPLKRVTWRPIR